MQEDVFPLALEVPYPLSFRYDLGTNAVPTTLAMVVEKPTGKELFSYRHMVEDCKRSSRKCGE